MQDNELLGLIRVGEVASIDPANGTARVTFDDDGITSYDLPVLVRNSYANKDYHMPDIGEDVLCLFLPSGVEQGFILGSFYTPKGCVKPPVSDPNKRRVTFQDGTTLEYDRAQHKLTADVKGEADVTATESVTVASQSDITLAATGDLTLAAGGALNISAQGDTNCTGGGSFSINAETINLGEPEGGGGGSEPDVPEPSTCACTAILFEQIDSLFVGA